MTNLIQSLTEAILRQEGMPADYTNPGNLRDCPWFTGMAASGKLPPLRMYRANVPVEFKPSGGGWMWVPRSRAEGVAGAAHVVALRIAMGQSLRQIISAWAPPSDGNNTEVYIRNVSEWAGLQNTGDVDRPLYELIE